MEIVESVKPIRIPPPISIVIEVAFAEMAAPTNDITVGPIASHFLSNTSERRPTMGDSTLCINSGPYKRNSELVLKEEREQDLNDPASDGCISKIPDDKSDDRACCYHDEDLRHDSDI